MSSPNFRLILDALDDYAKQTGIDLTKNPFADKLQGCNSPDSILALLQDKANAFKDFRDGNRKLINWLSPVVQVLHAFSGILGEAVSLVSPGIDLSYLIDFYACAFRCHSSLQKQFLSVSIFSSLYVFSLPAPNGSL